MTKVLFVLYTLAVKGGDILISILSHFNEKIRLLAIGRKNTWVLLQKFNPERKNVIWVHCASLGEFEQGRPVIEKWKTTYPDWRILLSFYSSSGYEMMKNYTMADLVIYLPSDLPSHNRKLLKHIDPKAIIFVKYEFWWNLIRQSLDANVKLYLVSGVFNDKNYFFSPVFSTFKKYLNAYTTLFVQDDKSRQILEKHGCYNGKVVGDTRIDRVIQRSKNHELSNKLATYGDGKVVVVYGSVWMSDLKVVVESINAFPDFLHIIAPHEVQPDQILEWTKAIKIPSDLYSDENWSSQVLVINNIGMLGGIYRMANYVYIGGGFQNGIHNTLEPAVFGVPIFFGPKHQKFVEAIEMVRLGAAFVVNDNQEMTAKIAHLEKKSVEKQEITDKLMAYFEKNQGATAKIILDLDRHLNH